ncbi:MAG TPA: hypothetical protein VFP53_07835 [Sphingomicrobium sp.]|nr:hypothetical protein [Sphingomicrobium sp.]
MIGGLIGLGFGWLWLLVGSTAAGGAQIPVLIAGSTLFALAGWRVVRRRGSDEGRFRAGYYIAAVIAEVAAIVVAREWLRLHHRQELLLPVIGIIVGLHFIGLWLAWRRDQFLWLTGALVGINLLAVVLPLTRAGRTMLSGFGSSASLLVAVAV